MKDARTRRWLSTGVVAVCAIVVPLSAAGAGASDDPGRLTGSFTNANVCASTLNPAIQPPSNLSATVALSVDGPEPHAGAPLTLTNTHITITTPAALVQAGIDGQSIRDGDQIQVVLTLRLAGTNTTEGSQTTSASTTENVQVIGGVAQPLVAEATLPDTRWHPTDPTKRVVFTEQSLTGTFQLLIRAENFILTQTLACTPTTTPALRNARRY